jgi:hypothetical protein
MFYNENNCRALPCLPPPRPELVLLKDNSQEYNGLPCFELALLEDNGQEDNSQ